MKRITFSVVVAAVLGLGAYTLAGAQAPGRGPGAGLRMEGRGGPGAMMMLRGVELSEAQRTQIRAFVEAARAVRGDVQEGTLRRELQAELLADAPDAQRIAALQQQIAQAHTGRLAADVSLARQIAQVLTADQRSEIRERLARVPERRGPDGGRGRRAAPPAQP